jgi:2-oxoglutarate ferredoxin oxidoreductase subunit alpha
LPDPPEKPWAASGYGGEGKPRVHESFFLDPRDCEAHNRRLQEKYDLITEKETRWEETDTQTADIVLVAYGLCSRICLTAMKQAGGEGLRVGLLRPITLWPFPAAPIGALAAGGKRFLVVEQSLGQMVQDVRLAVNGRTEVAFYGRPGGVVPAVRDILAALRAMARGTKQ